ncbi:non-ribosomal peptide synthetase [Bacillus sp. SRB3LM]|uniref:non-ribosomal peptide synthetase n=1 Tax=Bacillus sp. SRB3LM TaxID=2608689 RepID=UPI0018C42B84|nr:non-ribosomal peptide synthetase [Bacillus sp. SRB3LM]MBG0969476.1 amino acid adenylation domain-containing protein [Bacillus sp. SRB3LM]MBG0971977.1 amino acid adenylation domain-containing protein [Bacillus sp. SRB3LM]MBG0971999.1 amino acid adenylation domain-containing protein [Bacillus sp. SRB3LM]
MLERGPKNSKNISHSEDKSKLLNTAPTKKTRKYPLSPMQESMWYMNKLNPNTPSYLIQFGLYFHGELNIPLLKESFLKLGQRQHAFRTKFSYDQDHVPYQEIVDEVLISFEEIDFTKIARENRDRKIIEFAKGQSSKKFDLENGPLLTVHFLKFDIQEHAVIMSMHHIIADGPSVEILIKELIQIYTAKIAHDSIQLPKLKVQHYDIVVDTTKEFNTAEFENNLNYWKNTFSDKYDGINLPIDYTRSIAPSLKGTSLNFKFEKELFDQIRNFSRKNRTTPFTTLLAAFFVFLHRYTQQEDLIIGVPITLRDRRDTRPLIGCFINTLPIRVNLWDNPSFNELIERVKLTNLEAFKRKAVPYQKIVEAITKENAAVSNSVVQILMGYQKNPYHSFSLPNLKVNSIEFEESGTEFDIILEILEDDNALTARWIYSSEIFHHSSVSMMAQQFHSLLREIVQNPDQNISDFLMLSETDRKILCSLNQTTTDYPKEKAIYQVFEEQVQKTPNHIALSFKEKEITYRELNEKANQYAHLFRNLGIAKGDFVGVCIERSNELITTLLGILKIGAIYVPLDANYPQKRLEFMIQDSRMKWIITQKSKNNIFKTGYPTVITIDQKQEDILSQPTNSLRVTVNPTDISHVIYTSGSTGMPKGVLINHRNVIRLVKNTNYMQFDKQEVMLQLAPISFDASTFEIWGSLLNGGKLVIMPPETPTLGKIGETIRSHHITTLWLTSSLFNQMVENRLNDIVGLKYLIIGGESLSLSHVEKFIKNTKYCKLINGYGPTENTTFSCYYEIHDIDTKRGNIPIGQPISNSTVYILDENLKPVPTGVIGELYVGGDGIANGYLNQEDLTSERFIRSVFNSNSDEILYKTGDFARCLANGNIEFRGRIDSQVKVRGHRIELSEIEFALNEHLAVQQCAVVVTEDSIGDKTLVAYIVANKGMLREQHSISMYFKGFLQSELPSYMIPTRYFIVDSIPLTPNGKVDISSLKKVVSMSTSESIEYISPRDKWESKLSEIWEGILDIKKISITDNFFSLGGHSLKATRIISKINAAFTIDLELRHIFEFPTIEQMAKFIKSNAKQIKKEILSPLQNIKESKDYPVSFSQERMWIASQYDIVTTAYHVNITKKLKGPLHVPSFKKALNILVNRHPSFRTTFHLDSDLRQEIKNDIEVNLQVVDVTTCKTAEKEIKIIQLLNEYVQEPFDLSNELLFRTKLFKIAEQEYIWILVMHHILTDGWSQNIILNDLISSYNAISQGESPLLSNIKFTYVDYSIWQRAIVNKGFLDSQLQYWLNKLENIQNKGTLPLDFKRSNLETQKGASIKFNFNDELQKKLQEFNGLYSSTSYLTLLSVYILFLSKYSKSRQIVIGTPTANRKNLDVQNIVGCFVNTLTLTSSLNLESTFLQFLKETESMVLEADSNQEYPFDLLISKIREHKNLTQDNLFDVWFSLNDVSNSAIEMNDIIMEDIFSDTQSAKFDLNMGFFTKNSQVTGFLEYNTALFKHDTVLSMLKVYKTLLESVITKPEQTLATIIDEQIN